MGTDLKTAAQQALEVLKSGLVVSWHSQVVTDLEAALAEPNRAQRMTNAGYTRRPTLREMAEPEQEEPVEPVAWASKRALARIKDFDSTIYANGGFDDAVPLYTHPPRREWRSLSEEEIRQIALDTPIDGMNFARAIEAALKERNA